MTDIRCILVGVDFSDCSERALELAGDLAAQHHAGIVLLHVYQIPGFAFPETIVPAPPDAIDQLVDDNAHRLGLMAERLRARGLVVAVEQVPGAPATELVARASKGVDLVVVGTHGRTGLRHVLLGSVAERVVRRSPVPVMTVRAEDHGVSAPATE